MSYVDKLRSYSPNVANECGLGKVLETEGKEKYEDLLETIFAVQKDDDPEPGQLYPAPFIADLLREEYGWAPNFIRRHRTGECVACRRRDK